MTGSTLLAFAVPHRYQRHTMLGGIDGRPLLLAKLLLLFTAAFSSFMSGERRVCPCTSP